MFEDFFKGFQEWHKTGILRGNFGNLNFQFFFEIFGMFWRTPDFNTWGFFNGDTRIEFFIHSFLENFKGFQEWYKTGFFEKNLGFFLTTEFVNGVLGKPMDFNRRDFFWKFWRFFVVSIFDKNRKWYKTGFLKAIFGGAMVLNLYFFFC